MNDSETFSVWVFLPDETHFAVGRHLDAEQAVLLAKRGVEHHEADPASLTNPWALAVRIIITDGGDCICFEWRKGVGITFPYQATGKQ